MVTSAVVGEMSEENVAFKPGHGCCGCIALWWGSGDFGLASERPFLDKEERVASS
jgi:hypothetical protein